MTGLERILGKVPACTRCAEQGQPAAALPGQTLCAEHLGHDLIHQAMQWYLVAS